MVNYTYTEKNGIGYKSKISDVAKLILQDYLGEVIPYPAGDSVVLEINVNGVILGLANGRSVPKGTYTLYEIFMGITDNNYKLPDYISKKNVVGNFSGSGLQAGQTVAWQPPTHIHRKKDESVIIDLKREEFHEKIFQLRKARPIVDRGFRSAKTFLTWEVLTAPIIEAEESFSGISDQIAQDYQPPLLPLSPYIILDYREI